MTHHAFVAADAEYAAAPRGAGVDCMTLAQLTRHARWQLTLAHARRDHLLLWVTRGQGRACIDGARRGVGIHNAIFVPAGTLFSMELGAQAFGHAMVIAPGALPLLPETPLHLRIRDAYAQAEISKLFEAMQREISEARALSEEALAAQAQLVTVWLARQAQSAPRHDPSQTPDQALSSRFARLLEARFDSGWGLQDYAASLGVTPEALTRACQQATGRPAEALLNERLAHEAQRLLMDPVPPIPDVARQLGFTSPEYFDRFVERQTGKPPRALREAALRRVHA